MAPCIPKSRLWWNGDSGWGLLEKLVIQLLQFSYQMLHPESQSLQLSPHFIHFHSHLPVMGVLLTQNPSYHVPLLSVAFPEDGPQHSGISGDDSEASHAIWCGDELPGRVPMS